MTLYYLCSSFPITLEWNGAVVGEKVTWFQYESDISLNSNVYEVANKLVQKHFPGIVNYVYRKSNKNLQKNSN